MENTFNLLEKSQRLRYEAFSVFAAGVNKAETIEKIGHQLTSQLKFILDLFLARIYYSFEGKRLVFEIAKGECTISELVDTTAPPDAFHLYEGELLTGLLPVYLSKKGVEEHALVSMSRFNHSSLKSFFALPIRISASHNMVISIGNKEDSVYGEVDFRFLRLIGDLLSSKLSQLLLLEEIKSLNATLEKKVEERTGQLKKTNEELHTIFYRTSHDFRRPLTSILGLVQLAELTNSDSSASPIFTHMKSVVAEMDAMLGKLSILSTADKEGLTFEWIDFEEIFTGIKQKLNVKIQESHIEVRKEIEKNLHFYSNWHMIGVILENLIENAIHFHRIQPLQPSSTIEIPAYVEITISKKIKQGNPYLQLRIKDNGQGIDKGHIDKIFEIYYRANAQSKGNGLGLYVVKKLVTLLKGEIKVKSKVGSGSMFTILLPAQLE